MRVSGLEIMNDDPSAVRVLYGLVHSDELEEFANRCFRRFNQSGLSFDHFDRDAVKLHMTIMNKKFRSSNPASFDAREILKRWSDFNFGSVQCNELLLCLREGSNRDNSQFYKITDSIKFCI